MKRLNDSPDKNFVPPALSFFCRRFTNAFMYYGISYNTNELAGDPFLNFALYGVIEIPAYILTLFVIQSKGRRRPEALSCLAAGLSCWLIYPIPKGTECKQLSLAKT
ncbi:hypothetical protein AVEN_206857-1 [Araneus ventricosus]|uniref:Uncharacterized protein n=1 Tax=Araneus ventricosus TaxID=182803 RepID=A0A4Y2MD63_ARAVE|nr:hypothetical protein AVEN_239098-1 [Araneus ventricosus]GBN23637.1 hypothetical protein AVEN_16170-1 [Araneus ventricosus]GBN23694.1 hypothetical protein AVEN_130603-1 [Araneus ventricosus]GBN23756.1 hypothetical protein AVEN_206857-1 [Araneus ventricosus]